MFFFFSQCFRIIWIMKVMLLLSFSLTHKVFFLPGGGERGGRKAGTDRGRRGEHWRRPVWSHSPVLRDGHCVHFGFWWDPGCSCVSQHWSCTTLNIASAGPVCLFYLWISSHTHKHTQKITHTVDPSTPLNWFQRNIHTKLDTFLLVSPLYSMSIS